MNAMNRRHAWRDGRVRDGLMDTWTMVYTLGWWGWDRHGIASLKAEASVLVCVVGIGFGFLLDEDWVWLSCWIVCVLIVFFGFLFLDFYRSDAGGMSELEVIFLNLLGVLVFECM